MTETLSKAQSNHGKQSDWSSPRSVSYKRETFQIRFEETSLPIDQRSIQWNDGFTRRIISILIMKCQKRSFSSPLMIPTCSSGKTTLTYSRISCHRCLLSLSRINCKQWSEQVFFLSDGRPVEWEMKRTDMEENTSPTKAPLVIEGSHSELCTNDSFNAWRSSEEKNEQVRM